MEILVSQLRCGFPQDQAVFHDFYESKITQPCPTLCDPMDYTGHEILSARILERVAFPSPTNPGIKPRSSTLQADSLSAEPPGKSQGLLNLLWKDKGNIC